MIEHSALGLNKWDDKIKRFGRADIGEDYILHILDPFREIFSGVILFLMSPYLYFFSPYITLWLTLVNLNISISKLRTDLVKTSSNKLKIVHITLVSSPLNYICNCYMELWTIASGLHIRFASWRTLDWQSLI